MLVSRFVQLVTPDLAVVGYWLFSTPLIPLHRCPLGT